MSSDHITLMQVQASAGETAATWKICAASHLCKYGSIALGDTTTDDLQIEWKPPLLATESESSMARSVDLPVPPR
jgi:hypothetical protein